ncbi:GIY-YIG nuclease family protein [Nitratidesulfovibrio vulgaris]|uniref:DUF4357 domain-containing protein n=1 Tax=Nitratidesulfovibrio vulgaris (strain DP4) TaxID=391774 RepID=A0A0H3A607_NITV4|nr:GIY-YIG nuclease family protein [Nitratidesulfovibrio vulgaris]ABM27509.1 conserved hypothetical protein [Nitratidesulfovibrio vulgaris DP4]GEB79573.1 methionine sulfoxide reductase [Desulfovibrio desulfuricans]
MTSIGSVGRSLELFFIDGKPDGMQTAEVFNWTGHVLLFPRTRIKAALERKEARYTGVYLLLGEADGKPLAYIGEGEDIAARIRAHDLNKDWWTQAVLVTTGANALNKAHVKYLESRLVEIARTVKRWELENGNTPPRPGLSEAAQANMESFLSYLLMILPALRIDIFQEFAKPAGEPMPEPAGENEAAVFFVLVQKKEDLHARAQLVGDDFIVLEGSAARCRWVGKGSENTGYAHLHGQLLESGVLVAHEGRCVFARSYAFRSPSAAAAVVVGRSSNGTTN